jgi:hypothetical protein
VSAYLFVSDFGPLSLQANFPCLVLGARADLIVAQAVLSVARTATTMLLSLIVLPCYVAPGDDRIDTTTRE